MIFSGTSSRSFSISFLSQPARGGSRMTVSSGEIKERASSDFERTGVAVFIFAQFFSSSEKASLFDSTRVRDLSEATERPIEPTPE